MQAQHTPTRAAIYVRVSSTGQEDGYSLDTQLEACQRYAREHDHEVAAVFREVHTGVELWERPQLQALRDAVRRREVEMVIAYAIDRLSRDPVHLGVILSEAEHVGAAITFVTEPLDDSAEGQLIRFVRGYAARVEHTKIVERATRGRRARAESGKLLPGRYVLYGYERSPDGERYVEDPTRAPIVRRIFREAADGVPIRRIAADLDRDGIPMPSGGSRWSRSSIAQILHHPTYAGDAVTYRKRGVKRNAGGQRVTSQTWRAEDDQIHLPEGTAPALVDREAFAVVQERLTRNRQQAARRNRHPEAAMLRAGYGVCGLCGARLYVKTTRGKLSYTCGGAWLRPGTCKGPTMHVTDLDVQVWADITAFLERPDQVAANLAKRRTDDPTREDVAAVERAIGQTGRRRDNLIDRLAEADDGDVIAAIQAKIAALTEELRRLERERDALLARRKAWETANARMDDLMQWCAVVSDRLRHDADYQVKRDALEYLDIRVQLYPHGAPRRYTVEGLSADTDGAIVSASAS